jgi:ribosomal protein S18 acetylase RimI-like enzyme
LGRPFLSVLYHFAIARDPGLCLLLYAGHTLIGFAVGIRKPREFYRALLLSRFLKLSWCLTTRPELAAKFFRQLVRGLKYSLHQPLEANAKLLSIAIDPAYQGLGFGGRLLDKFLKVAAPFGPVWLETDANDNSAGNLLYSRHGMHIHSRMRGPSGKERFVYVHGDIEAVARLDQESLRARSATGGI